MKKLRLKKKNATIALLIVLFIIIEIINPSRIIAVGKLTNYGYTKESSKRIISLGLKNKILENKYNKFIDLNINDEAFNKDNFDSYIQIDYSSLIDLDLVNKLLEKKYSGLDISYILKSGDTSSINTLLEKEKIEDISDYLKYSYSKLSLLDRYIEYKKINGNNYEDTVTYVNIGLDKDFYSDYKEVTDFSFTMLVNKYNRLNSDFIPSDLVAFPSSYCSSTCPMDNKIVVEAFTEMAEDLKKEENLSIYVNSAYRTYEYQEETYDRLTKAYGENYDVAKPGFSEHQTGLVVDIGSGSSKSFKGSKEEAWLKKNAHKYGFILRYDSSKVKITGYNEPWHFRYVGKEIAEDVFAQKLTYDEYYVRYLER